MSWSPPGLAGGPRTLHLEPAPRLDLLLHKTCVQTNMNNKSLQRCVQRAKQPERPLTVAGRVVGAGYGAPGRGQELLVLVSGLPAGAPHMGISPQRKVGDSAPSTATTPLPNCGGSPRTSEPGMRTKPAKVWTMETAPRSSPLAGRNGTGGVLRLPFNGSRFNSSVIPRAQQQERRRPSRALGPRPKAFLQASPEGPGLAACLPGSPHTHTHTQGPAG